MIDIIIDIFYSDTFQIILYSFFFIDGFLMLVVSVLIGRPDNIKKMDYYFINQLQNFGKYQIHDYGIWLNAQRAFSYGMSILFPKIFGKKVHKKVDISKIPTSIKWPYIIHTLLVLLLIPIFLIASLF